MNTPALCVKHQRQVGNYFDTQLAYRFEVNQDECVVCQRLILVEEARRFLSPIPQTNIQPVPAPAE